MNKLVLQFGYISYVLDDGYNISIGISSRYGRENKVWSFSTQYKPYRKGRTRR